MMGIGDQTLVSVLERTVRNRGSSPALLSFERSLTWKELLAESNQLAHLFVQIGIGPGDVVGLVVDKRPEVVVAFLACARVGAIVAPVNFKLQPDQVRAQFRTAGIRAVLTQSSLEAVLEPVADLLTDPKRVIAIGPFEREGVTPYDALSDQPRTAPPGFQPTPHTVCYYNYTSGTTGRPKGAVTTHHNILVNGVATIEGLGFRDDDVFLGMFSVFAHPHELFHRSLIVGGAFAIVDSLNPRIVAEAVERFRVTWMMGVPSFYEMLLDHKALSGGTRAGPDLGTLRVLESGGAYVGAQVLGRMEEAFGATFLPVWGCTEATGVGLALPPGPRRRPGATGFPVPGYDVSIRDSDDQPVAEGEIGEMCIRGPAVSSGYIHDPDETAMLFRGGWYHTKDLVRAEPDGAIQFIGRLSEMLKVGGIRVYPLEIEEVLLSHPEVRNVVVVGAEERIRGEIARAIVELSPESTVERKALLAFCRARLAGYKVPRVLEVWTHIPRLPNGKTDKRAVAQVAVDPSRDDRTLA